MPKTPDFRQNKTFEDLINEATRPKPLPETGWNMVGPGEDHGVDFQNGHDNFSDTAVPCSWYLSEDGEVRLRGRII
jgi:hypothetical protein